jgi:hypothetical protein
MANFQIVNPLEMSDWDKQVLLFPEVTIFHSAAWAKLLHESYNFVPFYIVGKESEKIVAVLPVMEVRGFWGDKKGVSLPFSDFCQPLFNDANAFGPCFDFAKDLARNKGWNTLELRGNAPFPDAVAPSTFYYRHILDLGPNEEALFENMRGKTRTDIRRAIKTNVSVTFETSLGAVKEFYRLNCLTRKRHGLPPQPYSFFENLHRLVISQGMGEIALGHFNGVISASVFLRFGNVAFYKFSASDERFKNSRATYLIIWEAVRKYRAAGCVSFCFGRTEPQHESLLQFKTGWGARQITINNYLYDFKKHQFITSSSKTSGVHTIIFGRMPVPLLKLFGTYLYKHFG